MACDDVWDGKRKCEVQASYACAQPHDSSGAYTRGLQSPNLVGFGRNVKIKVLQMAPAEAYPTESESQDCACAQSRDSIECAPTPGMALQKIFFFLHLQNLYIYFTIIL